MHVWRNQMTIGDYWDKHACASPTLIVTTAHVIGIIESGYAYIATHNPIGPP